MGELLGVDAAEHGRRLGTKLDVVLEDLFGNLAGRGRRTAVQLHPDRLQLLGGSQRHGHASLSGLRHCRGRRRHGLGGVRASANGLLHDDAADLAHPGHLGLDRLHVLAEAVRQRAGLEQFLLGVGTPLQRIAVAVADRVASMDREPGRLAAGEKSDLLQRIFRRILGWAKRRLQLRRFRRLLAGLHQFILSLQLTNLGQQLHGLRLVRIRTGPKRRGRLEGCHVVSTDSRERRGGRRASGVSRRSRRGDRLLDGFLRGNGCGRLIKRILPLEARRFQVGQHLARTIAEVPHAIGAVQLLGAVGGALGVGVSALLHQLAGVGQRLGRFLLVVFLPREFHVLAQSFG